MIYTTCLMCYATFSYSKSRLYSFILALSLISLAVFITLYYHYLQDPAFHQNAYALLTAIVLFRSMYVMEFSLRPSLTKKEEEFKSSHRRSMSGNEKEISRMDDRRNARILRTMWTMIATGLSIFLGGFLLWHLDNEYCSTLRIWRRRVGLPWGIVLEGHGWWLVLHRSGILDSSLMFQKASYDWSRCFLLYYVGHMAPSLLEWSAGRIYIEVAFSTFIT